jgi:DNA polymerase-3 subunit gamma/tau
VDEIVANLKKIVKAEKIQADDDALIQIARQSAGGMRDAISLLDQLSSTGDKITLALAQNVLGTATSQTVLDVLSSINEHDPAHGLETIHKALDDPRSLARQIVEYLRGLMLIQMGNVNQVEATAEVKKQMQSHARSFTTSDVLRMMKAFNNAAVDLRGGWQPSLSLELALAEVLDAPGPSMQQIATPVQPKPQPVSAAQTESMPKAESEPPRPAETDATQVVHASDIIKSWKRLSSALPKSQANLSGLMNSVKMIDVHGTTLVLGFASDVLVSKMEKPDHVDAIQKLIEDEFGVKVIVRCMVTNAKGKIPPNVPPDGMVATAIQHGGEIVDM